MRSATRTEGRCISNTSLVKRKLGDYEGAIKDYTEEMSLISSVSSKVKALNNRAFCHAKL